jgi:hypothetical protein
MTAMDHAAAHERIADLALEAGAPARLATSTEPADISLRAHLATCAACSSELAGWSDVQSLVAASLGPSALVADVVDAAPPTALRQRVLAASRDAADSRTSNGGARLPRAAETTKTVVPFPPRRARAFGSFRRLPLGLAAALALVVTAGLVGVGIDRAGKADAERVALGTVVSTLDRVLATPQHRVVTLQTASGAAAGSVSWNRHDLVVLTTALAAPGPNQVYRCYLEDGANGHAIGVMSFAGSTAYWTGSLDEWASVEWAPNSQFVVALDDAANPSARPGPVILQADLGS